MHGAARARSRPDGVAAGEDMSSRTWRCSNRSTRQQRPRRSSFPATTASSDPMRSCAPARPSAKASARSSSAQIPYDARRQVAGRPGSKASALMTEASGCCRWCGSRFEGYRLIRHNRPAGAAIKFADPRQPPSSKASCNACCSPFSRATSPLTPPPLVGTPIRKTIQASRFAAASSSALVLARGSSTKAFSLANLAQLQPS